MVRIDQGSTLQTVYRIGACLTYHNRVTIQRDDASCLPPKYHGGGLAPGYLITRSRQSVTLLQSYNVKHRWKGV